MLQNLKLLRAAFVTGMLVLAGLGAAQILFPREQHSLERLPGFAISRQTLPAIEAAPPAAPVQLPPIAGIVIPRIGVNASIVTLGIDGGGAMETPAGPADVAWYDFSAHPERRGNVVLAGHVDFAGHGPAVFYDLRNLRGGDEIVVTMADATWARYRVESLRYYNADSAPVEEIVGPTSEDSITLITCSGVFDPRSRSYDTRLIVRGLKIV